MGTNTNTPMHDANGMHQNWIKIALISKWKSCIFVSMKFLKKINRRWVWLCFWKGVGIVCVRFGAGVESILWRLIWHYVLCFHVNLCRSDCQLFTTNCLMLLFNGVIPKSLIVYSVHSMGMFSTLKHIYSENGVVRGLYRGMSINYLRAIPMVAVSFSTYEVLKQALNLDTGMKLSSNCKW